MAKPSIEEIAYHEAGHAVAFLRFGLRFDFVTIVPSAKHGCEGAVGHIGDDSLWIFHPSDLSRIEAMEDDIEKFKVIMSMGIALLAGLPGQRLINANADARGSRKDLAIARSLLLSIRETDEKSDIEPFLEDLHLSAHNVIQANKATVCHLAEMLLEQKTMSYRKLRQAL